MRFIIGLAFFFCCSIGFSQDLGHKTYTIYINQVDKSIQFDVLISKPLCFHPSVFKSYYWYLGNDLHFSQGGYEGKLLHGQYSALYLSNDLKEKGRFRKGLKVGRWTKWHEDGKISEISHWCSGRKKGEVLSYNDKGQLIKQAFYKNDLLNGPYLEYENDKVILSKKYHNGQEVFPKEKVVKTKAVKVETPIAPKVKVPLKVKIKNLFKSNKPAKPKIEKVKASSNAPGNIKK